ncbi:hypothetical protein [uncultured Sphingomonas sp.]|uniref:hypothetical protein n=1 Tax=uncultured Sphingomonas sp. TaxID=158754 RepID=UPI0025876DD8|nr:hypothetical protein [uncultured Sphingomonas sp.]
MTATRIVHSAADGTAIAYTSPDIVSLIDLCRDIQARPARETGITVPFGDGLYRLQLGRKQVEELERSCAYQGKNGEIIPLGVGAIFARVAKGRAFLPTGEVDWSNITEAEILASEITQRDCVETIRLGLIGGNHGIVNGTEVPVSAARALQLIDAYVVGQPVQDAWHYAFATLGALIYGVEAPPAPEME